MIRLRKSGGELQDLSPDTRFVEIISADNKLAACIWIDDGDVIHVSRDGDQDFDRYIAAFGLQSARVIELATAIASV